MIDLIQQYRQLHQSRAYGISSMGNFHYLAPHVREIAPRTILDFGCGQSRLPEALSIAFGVQVCRYDPAIPEYEARPSGRFDMLINIDVLEHVPEDEVETVIRDMATFSDRAIIIIDTVPAKTLLPDGRNAHITLHSPAWWKERINEAFPIVEPIRARARRRAAFKTWHSPKSVKLARAAAFPFDYMRYRALKRKLEIGR